MTQKKDRSERKSVRVIHRCIGKEVGRIRFDIDTLYRSLSMQHWLKQGFSQHPGVLSVIANHRTGTLLIIFKTKQCSAKKIVDIANSLLKENSTTILKKHLQHKFPMSKAFIQLIPKKPWYSLSEQEVLDLCKSSKESGLTDDQARHNLHPRTRVRQN